MKVEQVRAFVDAGVLASVVMDGGEDYLEIGQHGKLAVPQGIEPKGFHLVVAVRADSRIIVVQKNVSQELGTYHSRALSDLEGFAKGFRAVVMREPIQVMRAGRDVWTSWHSDRPNRLDIWSVEANGEVSLFQVGVITHDNGKTWMLLGEYAWKGQLYGFGGRIVGKPEHVKWGSFEVRRMILDLPEFAALVKSAKIADWTGTTEELNPHMDSIPVGHARMQWYKAFAGQTGQGPATLHDGSSAWVHGVDVNVPPDPDGIVRIWQGDLIKFKGTAKFGSKPGKPPKLTGVSLVKRDW